MGASSDTPRSRLIRFTSSRFLVKSANITVDVVSPTLLAVFCMALIHNLPKLTPAGLIEVPDAEGHSGEAKMLWPRREDHDDDLTSTYLRGEAFTMYQWTKLFPVCFLMLFSFLDTYAG